MANGEAWCGVVWCGVVWCLPAVLLLEDVEVHPVPPPVLVCLSENLRDGLVNTGEDLRVARGQTLHPLLGQEQGYPVPVPVAGELYGAVHHVQGDVQPGLVSLLQALARHPQEPGQAGPGCWHLLTEQQSVSESLHSHGGFAGNFWVLK